MVGGGLADLLLPCSISGLLDASMTEALRAKAVVPKPRTPPSKTRSWLKRCAARDIPVLPDPLVNAGAVIS